MHDKGEAMEVMTDADDLTVICDSDACIVINKISK
jgi:hypothetical protein